MSNVLGNPDTVTCQLASLPDTAIRLYPATTCQVPPRVRDQAQPGGCGGMLPGLQAWFISSHRGQKPQGQEVAGVRRGSIQAGATALPHAFVTSLPFLVSMASKVTIVPDSAKDEPEAKGSREQACVQSLIP